MLNRATKPLYARPLTVSKLGLFFMLIMLTSVACNLESAPPTMTPEPTNTPLPMATITDIATSQPTVLPLPSTGEPVTSVPSLNSQCQVYITYSGSRAENRLSLRADPSSDAPQLFRVPNNVEVLRVPGSEEVEGDGYHWLNVIYSEPSGTRYSGWIARDSYEINGVRDPTVATLRATGTQRPC